MRRREQMTAVPDFAMSVVAEAIRRQPLSPGKVTLAWQMAAGPQLARASRAEIDSHAGSSVSLTIHARDPRWAAEIDRLRPVLADRLALLLGKQVLALHVA
jgi:hypothetical protein